MHCNTTRRRGFPLFQRFLGRDVVVVVVVDSCTVVHPFGFLTRRPQLMYDGILKQTLQVLLRRR